MPEEPTKRLIVVGDRVLVAPAEGEERTTVGLYLPEPAALDDEPWKIRSAEVKYLPVQAHVGDYALFFRKAAVEITFEDKSYLVVPQAAILVLVREGAGPG